MPTIPEVLAEIKAKEEELEALYELAKLEKLTEYYAAVAIIEADNTLTAALAQKSLQDALQIYIKEIDDIS